MLTVHLLDIKRRIGRIFASGDAQDGKVEVSPLERAIRSRNDIAPRVADAVLKVPRAEFVLPSDRGLAEGDRALSIGQGQTISQPSLVAQMISELALTPNASLVLDVGCGSGYQTAILSLLAEKVIAVERIEALAESARSRLARLGYHNVEVVLASENTLGYPDAAPYDAIIVGAGVPSVPKSLVEQLKIGARLVIPVGQRGRQEVATVTRTEDDFEVRYGVACVFVPLIGPEAW